METKIAYRYPGVKPFAEEEQHIFFGRETDTDKLFKRIMIDKLTLLYSKSGLGKSSLLNAGVIPRIKLETDYLPVYIRFGSKTPESIEPVENCLRRLPLNGAPIWNEKLDNPPESLWLRFKNLQAENPNRAFLLVFDQFEELFTYTDEQKLNFRRQLADVLYTKLPADIRKTLSTKLKENEHYFSDEQLALLYKQPELKIIFSIRSDRMSLLNQFTDFLPDIQKNYYELEALDRKRAEVALTRPAKAKGEFLSKPFDYAPESIAIILDYLIGNNKPIETFQLQTICQFAEQSVIETGAQNSILQPEMFGDLKNVFRNHYEKLMGKIPDPRRQLAARILVEEKLIVDGNRVNLPDVVVMKQEGINAELIKYLHDEHHLLRSEPNTVGGISYELSHDTLVAPVLEAKKEREEREEEERARRENEEKLREAHEKQQKQRKRTILVGFMALLFLGIGIFGLVQWRLAENRKEIANKQTRLAESQTQIATKKTEELKQKQIEIEKTLVLAKAAKDTALIEKAKAQRMVEALMPPEAVNNQFAYFWKLGKQSFAKHDYNQANLQILLAKEAPNLPREKKDSVDDLYQKVKPLLENYKKGIAAFYANQYKEAKVYFDEIVKRNREDTLCLFYAKACGDFKTTDMVLVKGGTIEMTAVNYRGNKEGNTMNVSLSSYYIAKYEVTNAQYARFLNEKSAEFTKKGQLNYADTVNEYIDITGVWSNEMKSGIYLDNTTYKVVFGYENRPVAYVSWYGADAFCRFYIGLRLPSEAQWEYAARGGDVGTRHALSLPVRQDYAGSNNPDSVAWYDNNSGSRSHSVGTKLPNQLGLFDMSGNLWEWCYDWYDTYPKGNFTDYVNDKDGSLRVYRGGSWGGDAGSCRVAFRSYDTPDDRFNFLGFRLVRPD